QKCLIQMSTSGGKGYVFLETHLGGGGHRHAVMECIPIPSSSMITELPGYFKEALTLVDEEWSQHRKIIETGTGGEREAGTNDRSFRTTLTPQLPYFHVWFGLDGRSRGMGHVIEDRDQFPSYFVLEVVGEVINGWGEDHPEDMAGQGNGKDVSIEPRRWRKPRHLPKQEWQAIASNFSTQWDPYDWTKTLG
ncbi:hypothetical protein BJ684DRAFT_13050, partial [Piptocephalis cylindrospora]